MNTTHYLGLGVYVKWCDSNMAENRWLELDDDYSSCFGTVESWGKIIYEDDKVIAIAHNYIDGTDGYNLRQVNGTTTIPKVCILEIKPFSPLNT